MRESHTMIALAVGERLKLARGSQTQAEFAARLGLRQAQYNRYETGRRLAPDDLLTRAAALAGTSAHALVFGPPDREAASPPPRAAAPPNAPADFAGAVAALARGLATRDQEDLFYFLRGKLRQKSQAAALTAAWEAQARVRQSG